MKISRNIFLPIILFGIASAAFIVLIIYPIFQGVVKDHKDVLTLKQERVQIREDRERLKDFENVLERYQSEFAQLNNIFLDAQNPVEFFRFLDTTANTFQLSIEINPGDPEKKAQDVWPSMDIQIQGEGEYPNIIAFIEKIESAPNPLEVRAVDVKSLDPSGGGSENEEKGNTFFLTVKVFTRGD